MDKGFGEESPGFRISELAKKVLNVDGRMLGKDGKPLVARRNVIHTTDVGSKVHNDGSISSTVGKDIGNENATAVNVEEATSGKMHEMHELPKVVASTASIGGGNTTSGVNEGSSSSKSGLYSVQEPSKVDLSDASVNLGGQSTVQGEESMAGQPNTNELNNGTGAAKPSFASVVKPSSASMVMNDKSKAKVNFRKVETTAGPNGEYEAMIPISSVKEVANRLDNSLYGYFIGKRIAFPVVDNYVRNAWGKYGIQKVMMNAKGFYFFKFASSKGVDDVLENGPWMIRTVPIILNKWTPSVCLTKENHDSVPVWVKIHDIPIAAFTADGLSVIASKVGNPLMMDAYTSTMCEESWGRSSYARVMIEVCAKDKLKEEVVVAVPKIEDEGYICATCRVEYEWRPPQCGECKIFGHTEDACPKLMKPHVNKESGKSNADGFQQVNKVSGKPNVDGFQQVKGKIKAKQQNFKPRNKFVYRPVNTSGKQTSGGSLKTSNSFEPLAKHEVSAKQDTFASSSENAGNQDRGKKEMTSTVDGKEWKAPSLYEKWKQTDGYEDDDSDDVLDEYDYDMTNYLDSQERQGRRKS